MKNITTRQFSVLGDYGEMKDAPYGKRMLIYKKIVEMTDGKFYFAIIYKE